MDLSGSRFPDEPQHPPEHRPYQLGPGLGRGSEPAADPKRWYEQQLQQAIEASHQQVTSGSAAGSGMTCKVVD